MTDQMWMIREPKASDLNFIYATWLNSYHYDSWTKSISKSVFFGNYKLVIDHILSNASILVACNKDEPEVIYGYIIYEPQKAHYVFVKEAFRAFGIARHLFEEAFKDFEDIIVTHRTESSLPILKKHTQLIFNPFDLYKKEI